MSGTSLACYGDQNGSTTVTIITQSSGNYTYTWSNGIIASGSSSTINNLPVGTYTVTVKDNVSGCTVIGAYVINSPSPLTISENITDISCFGETTGSIDIDVFGGSGPYQYDWNNGTNSQDISGVSAGNYSVTVYAPNSSCMASKSFMITEPLEALNHGGVDSDVDCFGESSGSVQLTVWGGTPPYSFSWNSGEATEDILNIPSGTYSVDILDSKNCPNTSSYVIDQPDIMIGTMSATNVSCYGDGSGSVSIDVIGGTPPYNYSWFNTTTLFAQNTSSMFNLSAENFHVVVTDNRNCTLSDSILITEPFELSGSAVTLSNVDCFGGNDGELNLTPSGGSPPYTFNWVNSQSTSFGSTEDLNDLPASVYTVVISDFNLCNYELQHEIFQPSTSIFVESQITDVKCYGENTGEVELNIQGGTAPFQISWSNGQSTSHISNLSADDYTYTVLDAGLCTFSNVVTVEQPLQMLDVEYTVSEVLCNGDASGSIILSAEGGTSPYSYSWSNSIYQLSVISSFLNNFPAEDYIFQVTDSQGCMLMDTVSIQEPEILTANFSITHVMCKGDSTGEITSNIDGGMLPYSFVWTNGEISSGLSFIPAGNYALDITDGNNCNTIEQVQIEEPDFALMSSYDIVSVTCPGGQNGSVNSFISGGTSPYNYEWSSQDTVNLIVNVTGGVYALTITDNNGCIKVDSLEVPQPNPIVLNEIIQAPSCYGFSDGIIDIEPEGGTSPYQYTWFDSGFALASQDQDLENVHEDVYQLEILDSNLCFFEIFVEVNQPDSLTLEYVLNSTPCHGESTGMIELLVSGGNPDYTFFWSNGSSSQNIENVPSGMYNVSVLDTKGCSDSLSIEIPSVNPIIITFDETDVSCIDQIDGTAIAHVTGGFGGYNYNWFDNTDMPNHANLESGWHTITVSDVLNCSSTDSIFIESSSTSCIDPVNTFTPNGDNYNDLWMIDNLALYPNIQLQIFNKWGNLIYAQTANYTPWDGNQNGVPLPSDTYYYIINLNKPDRDNVTGVITIIR
jgi:gliding motility-associated-like protein